MTNNVSARQMSESKQYTMNHEKSTPIIIKAHVFNLADKIMAAVNHACDITCTNITQHAFATAMDDVRSMIYICAANPKMKDMRNNFNEIIDNEYCLNLPNICGRDRRKVARRTLHLLGIIQSARPVYDNHRS